MGLSYNNDCLFKYCKLMKIKWLTEHPHSHHHPPVDDSPSQSLLAPWDTHYLCLIPSLHIEWDHSKWGPTQDPLTVVIVRAPSASVLSLPKTSAEHTFPDCVSICACVWLCLCCVYMLVECVCAVQLACNKQSGRRRRKKLDLQRNVCKSPAELKWAARQPWA